MASAAKYREDNRKLKEKLENTTLGDADTQEIMDKIEENNRMIETLSRKEKMLVKTRAPKVKPGKKTKKKTSTIMDGQFYI